MLTKKFMSKHVIENVFKYHELSKNFRHRFSNMLKIILSFKTCYNAKTHPTKHTSNKTFFQGYIFLFVIQFERWQMFCISYHKTFLFLFFSFIAFNLFSSSNVVFCYFRSIKCLCAKNKF